MDLLAFERIAADELAETIGFVCGSALAGAHFVQNDRDARLGGLKCGFAARKPGADDLDRLQVLF